MITTGSHFSGYGSYKFALEAAEIESKALFACDLDKYVRKTYTANHKVDKLYEDVANFPEDAPYVDLFVTTPPCQGLSLAGERKIDDPRNFLVHYSHQYILRRKPRFFLIENVKGLLSHNKPKGKRQKYGLTFLSWIELFAKEINGTELPNFINVHYPKFNNGLFGDSWTPHPECANYYVRFFKMNALDFGTPQNRERVFILGFRDEADYLAFKTPKPFPLTKRIRDVLEDNVDEKYYLSEKFIKYLQRVFVEHQEKGNGFKLSIVKKDDHSLALTAKYGQRLTDSYLLEDIPSVIQINPSKELGGQQPYQQNRIYSADGVCPALTLECGRYNVFIPSNQEIISNKNPKIVQLPRGKNNGGLYEDYAPTITKSSWQTNNILQHIGKLRKFTPKECSRLMSLPESFIQPNSDTQAYKQYGNGVDVNCLKHIFLNLKLRFTHF